MAINYLVFGFYLRSVARELPVGLRDATIVAAAAIAMQSAARGRKIWETGGDSPRTELRHVRDRRKFGGAAAGGAQQGEARLGGRGRAELAAGAPGLAPGLA